MANPVKIIIFQDDEDENHTTYIHSDFPLEILHFSKSDYEIEEEQLIIIENVSWELDPNGIGKQDPITRKEFHTIWSQGLKFINDRIKAQKVQRHEELNTKIHEARCNLEQLEREKAML